MLNLTSVFNLHLWGIAALVCLYLIGRRNGNFEEIEHSLRPFLKWLAFSVPVFVVAVAVLNYVVNPFGYYPTSFLKPLTFASRQEKIRLWSELPKTPDVIMLGSSRSFTLSPANLTQTSGRSAFNASFHWGTFRDYVAFLRYLIQKHQLPKIVIAEMSLDIMRSAPETALEANDPLRQYISDSYDTNAVIVQQYQALWSVTQTEQSIRSLLLEIVGRNSRLYAFDADGLGHFLHPDPQDEAINTYISMLKPDDALDKFDSAQIAYLQTFLRLCRDQNLQVIFYVPPYHPRLLSYFKQNGAFVNSEAELLKIVTDWREQGDRLTIHDFSDVNSFAGTSSMFFDAIHPTEAAGQLMLSILIKDFPAHQ